MTAYLHTIDEAALSVLLPLTRVGVWEGNLPDAEIETHLKPTLADGCADVPPKASAAGYALLEGLLEVVPFEDGVLLSGTQYLPVVAFHQPMYEIVIEKLAAALAGYDRIVARNFVNGKPGRPLASVAQTPVQVYGNMEWAAPGEIGTDYLIWEAANNAPSARPERGTEALGAASAGEDEAAGEEDRPLPSYGVEAPPALETAEEAGDEADGA